MLLLLNESKCVDPAYFLYTSKRDNGSALDTVLFMRKTLNWWEHVLICGLYAGLPGGILFVSLLPPIFSGFQGEGFSTPLFLSPVSQRVSRPQNDISVSLGTLLHSSRPCPCHIMHWLWHIFKMCYTLELIQTLHAQNGKENCVNFYNSVFPGEAKMRLTFMSFFAHLPQH